VRLRNLELDSRVARTQANYSVALRRAASATLRYSADVGPAREERAQLAQQSGLLASEAAQLQINSPISGMILTPRLGDRLGAYVPAGTELVEIADLSSMRARIYMSEHDISKFRVGSKARLFVDGVFRKWDGQVSSIEPLSSDIPSGLVEASLYKGLHPPKFYAVDLTLLSPEGKLKPGMVGTARVYDKRRSLAGFGWQEVGNFLGRRMW
jgi:multidrug resistance efflux pump